MEAASIGNSFKCFLQRGTKKLGRADGKSRGSRQFFKMGEITGCLWADVKSKTLLMIREGRLLGLSPQGDGRKWNRV